MSATVTKPAQVIDDDPRFAGQGWGISQTRPGTRYTEPGMKGRNNVPQRTWNAKRERQYEHIKAGLTRRGDSERLSKEIAARTVNKERARSGEANQSSSTSTRDISSARRGGLRSHRGAGGRTNDQLYEEAKHKGVRGRSKMTKAQLERAVGR